MKELNWIRIEESEQKELFTQFIKNYGNNFKKASNCLEITRSHLSKLKRGAAHYIPEGVLFRLVNHLNVKMPQLLFCGTLNEIRKSYMKEVHIILEQKYGKNWAKELTNRRDFKGIRLKDFPESIFVYLEDTYRKELFEAAYNLFGSLEKLAKAIKVSTSRLPYWYRGKQKDYESNKIGLQFIPLLKLKIISKFLIEDNREEFSMENIEKHMTMYRMQAGNPIKNPKFPIKESAELIRLLFHLLGDGYSGGKGDNANYRNTCKELLDEFRNDLRIFGDVPIYEQESSIKFPSVLAKIILDFYEIKSGTYDGHISNKILQVPKRNLYFGIRAFADDEGTAYSSSIRLASANYKLLEGLIKILDFLDLNHSSIRSQKSEKAKFGKMHYLEIKDLEKYHKYIGFTHPRKRKTLEFNFKRRKVHKAGYYPKDVTSKRILELLKYKSLTADQLSYALNISRASVDYHLEKLIDLIVLQGTTTHGAKLFGLNNLKTK